MRDNHVYFPLLRISRPRRSFCAQQPTNKQRRRTNGGNPLKPVGVGKDKLVKEKNKHLKRLDRVVEIKKNQEEEDYHFGAPGRKLFSSYDET